MRIEQYQCEETNLSVSLTQALKKGNWLRVFSEVATLGSGSAALSSKNNFSCFSGFFASMFSVEASETDVCKSENN
jgi:hypothetical protein